MGQCSDSSRTYYLGVKNTIFNAKAGAAAGLLSVAGCER